MSNESLPQQPKNSEQIFEAYKPALEKAAAILDENKEEVREHKSIQAVDEDHLFTIAIPYVRKGKHAFVAFVDVEEEAGGDSREFVFRDKASEAEKFRDNAAKKPIISSVSPQLYGIIGKWAVIEKIEGLELKDLVDKLVSDPAFSGLYQDKVIELIDSTSNQGVAIHDVDFFDGHNCKVDPETADLKFIEQTNAWPSEDEVREIQYNVLIQDLNSLGPKPEAPEQSDRISFLFSLMQKAHSKFDLATLCYRSRRMKPNHSRYKGEYFVQTWKDMPEELHQKLLEHPEWHENNALYVNGQKYSEAFSSEFVQAIESGDKDKFLQLIKAGKHKCEIKDEGDPRFGFLFLEEAAA